ncbi:hypothetical protein ACQUJV_19360 [Ralstonia pseudosolanacearum]
MEWASYNLALGVGAEKIVEELKHNGFEAGRARSPVTDIQLHPIFKAAKTLGGRRPEVGIAERSPAGIGVPERRSE